VTDRPLYHFAPPPGTWMNDPIPFHWRGEWHVFFQHNPNGLFWGTMHWGHAVSRDLVRWELMPIALAPTPGGPDRDGCFTGSVFHDGQRFCILYTGIPELREPGRHVQVQCLATSEDLVNWEKHPANPVIAEAQRPGGFGPCWRDPCVWREADGWCCLIGSQRGDRGAALLYRSDDLVAWEYVGPLYVRGGEDTGCDFECPDLFELGGRHVLLASRVRTWWRTGTVADRRFAMDAWGVCDGGSFYAGKTCEDDRGRRVLLGWVTEARSVEACREAGWAGALSLPRVLSVRPDGRLGFEPGPEVETLRGGHARFEDLSLAEEPRFLEGVSGDTLELAVRIEPRGAREVAVAVRATPDLQERCEVVCDLDRGRLGDTPLDLAQGEPLDLAQGEPLDLRIFVDRSIVEVFAGGPGRSSGPLRAGRACLTRRSYPMRDDALGVALSSRGGAAVATQADVWQLEAGRGA
jgi:beta-fructofuranosidase